MIGGIIGCISRRRGGGGGALGRAHTDNHRRGGREGIRDGVLVLP